MRPHGIVAMPLAVGLVCLSLLAGCALAGTPKPASTCVEWQTLAMSATDFQPNGGCVLVRTGHPITFTSDGVHILCTGPSNGSYSATCVPNSNAPAQFGGNSGDTFLDGTSQQMTFNVAGTYNIICIIHPNMRITVKVA